MNEVSDTPRAMGDLLRMGAVSSVDMAAKTCVVAVGELVTGPIRFPAFRAGKTRIWSPPHEGEQVLLACPEGDIAQAVVVASYYTDQHDAPSDQDVLLFDFDDGAQIQYDPAAHAMKVDLPGGGTLEITAPGGATITADVDINGDLQVNGDIGATGDVAAEGDVTAGDISLDSHTHTGVTAGSDPTGGPQ